MSAVFRNVDVEASAPVESWPYEALVTAIERGSIGDWARIARSIRVDPWGPVARQVEERMAYDRPYGVGPLLERAIERARADAVRAERAAVAEEVAALVQRSELSIGALAERLGTSRSRLSTYRSGAVVPSAALLVRLRGVVAALEAFRAPQ